jgi:hypothetical protein
VTPFFFRQAVYLASAALETPDVAPAPAAAVVLGVVEDAVVEVVLEEDELLPPQAAAARAVVTRSAASAPRWARVRRGDMALPSWPTVMPL